MTNLGISEGDHPELEGYTGDLDGYFEEPFRDRDRPAWTPVDEDDYYPEDEEKSYYYDGHDYV